MDKNRIRSILQRIKKLQKKKDNRPPFFEARRQGYLTGKLGIAFKSHDMLSLFCELQESLRTAWFHVGACPEQAVEKVLEQNERKAQEWIQQARKIMKTRGGSNGSSIQK